MIGFFFAFFNFFIAYEDDLSTASSQLAELRSGRVLDVTAEGNILFGDV